MKAQPHKTLIRNGWRVLPAGEYATLTTLSESLFASRQDIINKLSQLDADAAYVRTGRCVRRLTPLEDAEKLRRIIAPKTPRIRPDIATETPIEYLLATDLAAFTRTPYNSLRTRLRNQSLLTPMLGGAIVERTAAQRMLLDSGWASDDAAAPLDANPTHFIRWRTLPAGEYVSLRQLARQLKVGEHTASLMLNAHDIPYESVGCGRIVPLEAAQACAMECGRRTGSTQPPTEHTLITAYDREYLLRSDLTDLARIYPRLNPNAIPSIWLLDCPAYMKRDVLTALGQEDES